MITSLLLVCLIAGTVDVTSHDSGTESQQTANHAQFTDGQPHKVKEELNQLSDPVLVTAAETKFYANITAFWIERAKETKATDYSIDGDCPVAKLSEDVAGLRDENAVATARLLIDALARSRVAKKKSSSDGQEHNDSFRVLRGVDWMVTADELRHLLDEQNISGKFSYPLLKQKSVEGFSANPARDRSGDLALLFRALKRNRISSGWAETVYRNYEVLKKIRVPKVRGKIHPSRALGPIKDFAKLYDVFSVAVEQFENQQEEVSEEWKTQFSEALSELTEFTTKLEHVLLEPFPSEKFEAKFTLEEKLSVTEVALVISPQLSKVLIARFGLANEMVTRELDLVSRARVSRIEDWTRKGARHCIVPTEGKPVKRLAKFEFEQKKLTVLPKFLFSREGDKLVVLAKGIPAHVFDVQSGRLLFKLDPTADWSQSFYSVDNNRIVIWHQKNCIAVCNKADEISLFSLSDGTALPGISVPVARNREIFANNHGLAVRSDSELKIYGDDLTEKFRLKEPKVGNIAIANPEYCYITNASNETKCFSFSKQVFIDRMPMRTSSRLVTDSTMSSSILPRTALLPLAGNSGSRYFGLRADARERFTRNDTLRSHRYSAHFMTFSFGSEIVFFDSNTLSEAAFVRLKKTDRGIRRFLSPTKHIFLGKQETILIDCESKTSIVDSTLGWPSNSSFVAVSDDGKLGLVKDGTSYEILEFNLK